MNIVDILYKLWILLEKGCEDFYVNLNSIEDKNSPEYKKGADLLEEIYFSAYKKSEDRERFEDNLAYGIEHNFDSDENYKSFKAKMQIFQKQMKLVQSWVTKKTEDDVQYSDKAKYCWRIWEFCYDKNIFTGSYAISQAMPVNGTNQIDKAEEVNFCYKFAQADLQDLEQDPRFVNLTNSAKDIWFKKKLDYFLESNKQHAAIKDCNVGAIKPNFFGQISIDYETMLKLNTSFEETSEILQREIKQTNADQQVAYLRYYKLMIAMWYSIVYEGMNAYNLLAKFIPNDSNWSVEYLNRCKPNLLEVDNRLRSYYVKKFALNALQTACSLIKSWRKNCDNILVNKRNCYFFDILDRVDAILIFLSKILEPHDSSITNQNLQGSENVVSVEDYDWQLMSLLKLADILSSIWNLENSTEQQVISKISEINLELFMENVLEIAKSYGVSAQNVFKDMVKEELSQNLKVTESNDDSISDMHVNIILIINKFKNYIFNPTYEANINGFDCCIMLRDICVNLATLEKHLNCAKLIDAKSQLAICNFALFIESVSKLNEPNALYGKLSDLNISLRMLFLPSIENNGNVFNIKDILSSMNSITSQPGTVILSNEISEAICHYCDNLLKYGIVRSSVPLLIFAVTLFLYIYFRFNLCLLLSIAMLIIFTAFVFQTRVIYFKNKAVKNDLLVCENNLTKNLTAVSTKNAQLRKTSVGEQLQEQHQWINEQKPEEQMLKDESRKEINFFFQGKSSSDSLVKFKID